MVSVIVMMSLKKIIMLMRSRQRRGTARSRYS